MNSVLTLPSACQAVVAFLTAACDIITYILKAPTVPFDLLVVALAVPGLLQFALVENISYQGYPVPPDRPWKGDQAVAGLLVLVLL